jgi:hypothetical protein
MSSELRRGLKFGLFNGLGCALPVGIAIFFAVYIATKAERTENKDGGFTLTIGNPAKVDKWKKKLPDGATNVVEKGNEWVTFEWDEKKFLYRGGYDPVLTELGK